MKVRSEHCQCLCTEARVIHSRKDGRQCQHGHSFNWASYLPHSCFYEFYALHSLSAAINHCNYNFHEQSLFGFTSMAVLTISIPVSLFQVTLVLSEASPKYFYQVCLQYLLPFRLRMPLVVLFVFSYGYRIDYKI